MASTIYSSLFKDKDKRFLKNEMAYCAWDVKGSWVATLQSKVHVITRMYWIAGCSILFLVALAVKLGNPANLI